MWWAALDKLYNKSPPGKALCGSVCFLFVCFFSQFDHFVNQFNSFIWWVTLKWFIHYFTTFCGCKKSQEYSNSALKWFLTIVLDVSHPTHSHSAAFWSEHFGHKCKDTKCKNIHVNWKHLFILQYFLKYMCFTNTGC